MRNTWHMQIVRGEEEEKGVILISLNPLVGLLDPFIGQIFITETCLMTASIKTNATNSIMNGGIMSMTPVHL